MHLVLDELFLVQLERIAEASTKRVDELLLALDDAILLFGVAL